MTSVAYAFTVVALLLAWSAHAEIHGSSKRDWKFVSLSSALSTLFFLAALMILAGAV
jgi:hypothetical protein